MKIERGHFYSFKIKDRKEEEQGVLIEEGEEWVLLKRLFIDYILDGYMLINKSYIISITRNENDVFIENVLRANDKIKVSEHIEIPLSSKLLFEWLYNQQIVFQIDNKDETMCWVGKICDSTDQSIFLTNFTPKGIWRDSYHTFRKNNIRIISFDTDYINSLVTYNMNL